jgi:hypothetical protein
VGDTGLRVIRSRVLGSLLMVQIHYRVKPQYVVELVSIRAMDTTIL